jgi:Silicon transporter
VSAIINGQTTRISHHILRYGSIIILFSLLSFVGMMKGMQIIFFAVVNLPKEELAKHPVAATNCYIIFVQNKLGAVVDWTTNLCDVLQVASGTDNVHHCSHR